MCSVYPQWDFLLSTLLTTHHPCSDRAMLLLRNEKRKKESKLHNHQLLRPICVGRPENTGASASSRACCHKALMLLDVTAALRTSPATLIGGALSQWGAGLTALIHSLCPQGLKGSLWTTLCTRSPGWSSSPPSRGCSSGVSLPRNTHAFSLQPN